MLLANSAFPAIIHRTLLTAGVGESFLAEHIKDFETSLPEHIRLAYPPNYGMVRLRLTATGAEKETNGRDVQTRFETSPVAGKGNTWSPMKMSRSKNHRQDPGGQ